jgi:hypothetical protein
MKSLKELTQLKITRIINLLNRGKITVEEYARRRDEILFQANAQRK